MASRSIICRSQRLRQIIYLRDTDKSRYFAITEFNNCFIIRSPSLFSYFNHFLTAQGSDSLEKVVPITHEQNIICSKTRLDGTTHEQTIICRQLFAGHVVGSQSLKRKKKMHWMIRKINCERVFGASPCNNSYFPLLCSTTVSWLAAWMQAHACSLKGLKSSNASVRRPGMETTAKVIKKTLLNLGMGLGGVEF